MQCAEDKDFDSAYVIVKKCVVMNMNNKILVEDANKTCNKCFIGISITEQELSRF